MLSAATPPVPLYQGGVTDYPPVSVKRGEQGIAKFTVKVSKAGNPVDCTVTASSGYQRLDKQTCVEVIRNMRFTPARDSAGAAIEGSFSSQLKWALSN